MLAASACFEIVLPADAAGRGVDEAAGGLRLRPRAAQEAAGRPATAAERPARRSDDEPPAASFLCSESSVLAWISCGSVDGGMQHAALRPDSRHPVFPAPAHQQQQQGAEEPTGNELDDLQKRFTALKQR
jgi:hypothetical protein